MSILPIDFARDSWQSRRVLHHLGDVGNPWSARDMLSFFETQTAVHDAVEARRGCFNVDTLAAKRRPTGSYAPRPFGAYTRELLQSGHTTEEIQKAVLDRFGYAITRQAIRKIRFKLNRGLYAEQRVAA